MQPRRISSIRSSLQVVLCLAISAAGGCAHAPPKAARPKTVAIAKPQPEEFAWGWIDAGSYRAQFTRLTALPNTGLQLPVVSPDGRWIAALACADSESLDPEATLTGRSLASTSLVLFDTTQPEATPRLVSASAAWPVWSADSKRLVAVAYDKAGHCGLIVHDLASGENKRHEIGLAHIVTPALSPVGNKLAFAAFGLIAQQARIYVYDLDKNQLTPLAAPKDVVWQIAPMWVNDHAVIYYGRVGAETGLLGTGIDAASRNSWLAKLPLPDQCADAIRAQAGIQQSLAPDGLRLATFETSENRIALTHLEDANITPLEPSSPAGIWAGKAPAVRFIYSTDRQLHMRTLAGDSRVLADQPLLPLWCSPGGKTFLLLSPGQQRWSFDLMRMQIQQAR